MYIYTFNTPGLAISTYLIADISSRKAVIIDPTREIDLYLDYAKKENLQIQDILETHVHADFVSGAPELKQACEDMAIIHCSAMGGSQWIPFYADHLVQAGDTLDYPTFRLTALHTPGHTYEHVTWICYDKTRSLEIPFCAFTGDFLFVGSVGRPDLLGQSDKEKLAKMLYDSLFIQMEKMPDSLILYPAHGAGSLCGKALGAKPTSTWGEERKTNPHLKKKPFVAWESDLTEGMSPAPKNFGRIKKINLQGPSKKELDQKNTPEVFIDIRAPEKFAVCHIEASLNIPLGRSFCNWVGSVLHEDNKLAVIAENNDHLLKAIKNLKLIGFDQIGHKLLWDQNHFKNSYNLVSEDVIDVEQLHEHIQSKGPELCIVDVRTISEWNSGHIEQAKHIELSDLVNQLDKLPTTGRLYTICASGYRAALASSYLKHKGYSSVYNVTGGMNAWIRACLPILRDE
jgi:hydroxyacylglutathione hydrolase